MELRLQIRSLLPEQEKLIIQTLLSKGEVAAIRQCMELTGVRLTEATQTVLRLAQEIEPGQA